jgi:hypothetical protein
MRKIPFVMCILVLPCISFAQANQASWAMLSGLRAGQSIQVIDISSKKHSGAFLGVSDTAVSLRAPSGEQSIQKQDVRTVKLVGAPRRARNVLIGGAVGGGLGAGVGAGIGAATHKGCSSQAFCLDFLGTGGSAGIGAGLGFVAGAIVGGTTGALVPHHTSTLFDTTVH